MPIYQGSRYRLVGQIQIEDENSEVNRIYLLRETTLEPPDGSSIYQVRAGETFESLAFRWYGDANKWSVLADANPRVFFPLDLVAGMKIYRVPASTAAAQ